MISSGGALRNVSGTNSYGGAITLGSASRINADAGTLTLSGNIGGAGQNLTVGGAANTAISGVIGTTTGTLTKDGAGILTLTGANTYTGATTITAGTLQIGNGGTTGSIAGNVTDNAVLAFNRSNAITYAGVVSGSGSLTQAGTGTLTLSGANTYTGGTTVSAGVLAGTTTSLQGNIVDNANVTFSQTTTGTYAGVASGTGSLTKAGTGTVILSGANTYTGGTTISAGTLQVGNGGTTGSISRQCHRQRRPRLQPHRQRHLWGRRLRHRLAHPGGQRYPQSDGCQHLHRHHDGVGRCAQHPE